MKTIAFLSIVVGALALAGCAQDIAMRDGKVHHVAYLSRPDYFKTRSLVVGSHLPVRRDLVTSGPVFIGAPADSIYRDRPSLYPIDPVFGATSAPETRTASGSRQ